MLEDGDHPPATAAATLHAYVSRMRRALEPDRPSGAASGVLVHESSGYVLQVGPDDVDAQRFERLVATRGDALAGGDAAAALRDLDEGLALWRGEVLADLADAAFVVPEAARLDQLRLAAIEDRHDAMLVLGRHSGVVAEATPVLAAEPHRERLRAQLMLAADLGRWDDAEDHFRAAHEANLRMGAHPYVAWNQIDHARMLLTRRRPGDAARARSLAMEARSTTQRLELSGLRRHLEKISL